MKVYLVSDSENISVTEENLLLVPEERREKIRRYSFEEDKRISLICGLLIRLCAVREKGSAAFWTGVSSGKFGKPCFTEYPDLYFSASHTRNCVVLASSEVPVGIDTEMYAPLDDAAYSIARNYFTADEYESIVSSSDPAERFYRIWTAKEAFLKCTGEGLSRPLDSFSVYSLPEGYSLEQKLYSANIISVCRRGEPADIDMEKMAALRLLQECRETAAGLFSQIS